MKLVLACVPIVVAALQARQAWGPLDRVTAALPKSRATEVAEHCSFVHLLLQLHRGRKIVCRKRSSKRKAEKALELIPRKVQENNVLFSE